MAVTPVPFLPTTYLAANRQLRPDAPAVLDPARSLTFAELDDCVRATAAGLSERVGAHESAVIAVQLPNIWEYIVLELAIPLAGAVIMPLPLNLGAAEIKRALSATSPIALITSSGEVSGAARAEASALGIDLLDVQEAVKQGAPTSTVPEPPADAARIVEIALTSGTTGLPKLAALSAGLKQATFEGFTTRLEVTPADRVLIMSPLMQGIGGMCLFCLRVGAALVMTREAKFTAANTLTLAERFRATMLVGVPTNVIRLLEAPELAAADLSTCRCTAVAGAPMPPAIAQAWEERTGSHVVSFYGSMDAGQLAVGRPSDPADKRWFTVGRPHDSCECMIAGSDGRPVPVGETGEICMRGPTVQERYWGESSGPYSADGWAHMGDLGRLDADGYLEVVGRLKDIVIRGGANINPYEVEDAIRSHPSVRDVCVVGRPDAELGERAVAFVVGEIDLGEMREHLSRLGLAKYKWPEFVEGIEEIPLSGPGKVNRKLLKERAGAESAMR